MSESRVLIVQHGEKEAVAGDPGLTARGRRQATAAGQWLAMQGARSVVSSPMARALQTATTVAAETAGSVTVDERLRERMNWDGAASQSLPGFFDEWTRCSRERSFTPRSGQSSLATGARMLRAVVDTAAGSERPVVLVSHGGATVDLLRTLLGDERVRTVAPGAIENGLPGGGITELRIGGGDVELVTIGFGDHIPFADRT